VEGFRKGKKVNNEKDCPFLGQVGKDFSSPHNVAVKACENLLNRSQHIDKAMHQQTKQVLNKQLRLKASVDIVYWLAF